jgi:hypothetical protein
VNRHLLVNVAAPVLALVLAACAHHFPPPSVSPFDLRRQPTDSAVYQQLVQRARAGDTTVNYAQIRFLFARMPAPHPRVSADSLFAHGRLASSHEAARAALDSMLVDYCGNTAVQESAVALLRMRGDTTGARILGAVLDRFVHSMGDGPDAGKTWESAIEVVSVAEEYTWLRERGYRRSGMQSDIEGGTGDSYDELNVTQISTGKTLTLRFRWSRPTDRIRR